MGSMWRGVGDKESRVKGLTEQRGISYTKRRGEDIWGKGLSVL